MPVDTLPSTPMHAESSRPTEPTLPRTDAPPSSPDTSRYFEPIVKVASVFLAWAAIQLGGVFVSTPVALGLLLVAVLRPEAARHLRLSTDSPDRILLEGRSRWIGSLVRYAALLCAPLLFILLWASHPAALVVIGGLLTATWASRARSFRSLLITPEEVVIRRGWRHQRLARSRIRRIHLHQQEDRFRVSLEARDAQGANPLPGTELEVFSVSFRDGRVPPPETFRQLHRALEALDLRLNLTGLSLEEYEAATKKKEKKRPEPAETHPELRGLPASLRAVALGLEQPPTGTRFFPAQAAARGLLPFQKRSLPGAGLYLMPGALMNVAWGEPAWVVARERVPLVESSKDAAGRTSTRLLYANERGVMREHHFHGQEGEALQAWFNGGTPPSP